MDHTFTTNPTTGSTHWKRLPHWLETLDRYRGLLTRYLRPHAVQVGLLAIILAASIAARVAAPLVASQFINLATARGDPRAVLFLALLTMALALAAQGTAVAETCVAEQVSWAATNALRADLLAHLLRLDASFHASHTPGELIERVDGDVATLARFFSRFVLYVVGNGALMLGVLVVLYTVDWRVGLGLSTFVALAWVVILRIRASASPFWGAERQASADFYGFLGEYLAGLEDIRSSGAGAFVLRRCAEVMRWWLRVQLKAQMWGYALSASSQVLFALGTVVAFILSAALYASGTLTIGTVYLIFQCTEMLRQPTEQIRKEMLELQQADASIARVESLLRTVPALRDGPSEFLPAGPLAVELDGVTFTYTPDTSLVRDITVRVEPGRVLGIVGPTGCGKTTLIRLLARFYDPQAGAVRLGGVDVRSVPLAAVRGRIGLVTQEVQLFDASLRDNITLFDESVADERITAVLGMVGMATWLHELPHGLDTPLGPGGSSLSAGQAQVLACARIFLRDPDIVILDEASSRLDPATERLVQTAIGRLLEGRTGIVVAHRVATLIYADDILVLQDGRIREYGPREALAADSTSHYAELLHIAAAEVTQ